MARERNKEEMTYGRVDYRAPLRVRRDRRRGRPEMPTAVDTGVPHVPLLARGPLLATIPVDRQLFWQRSPICAALYGNVTHSVYGIINISAREISHRIHGGD